MIGQTNYETNKKKNNGGHMKTIIATGKLHIYASRLSHEEAFQKLTGDILKNTEMEYKASKIKHLSSNTSGNIKLHLKPNYLVHDYIFSDAFWYVGSIECDDSINEEDYNEIERLCNDMNVVPVFKRIPEYSNIMIDMSKRKIFKYVFNIVDHAQLFKEYEEFNQVIAEKIMSITCPCDFVWVIDHSLLMLPKYIMGRSVHISVNLSISRVFSCLPHIQDAVMASIKAHAIDFKCEESMQHFKCLLNQLKFKHSYVPPKIECVDRGIDREYISNVTSFLNKNSIDIFKKEDNLIILPVYSPDHLMCLESFVNKYKQDVTIILLNRGDLDIDNFTEIMRLSEYLKMNEYCSVYTYLPKNDIELIHLIMQSRVVFHPELKNLAEYLGISYIEGNECDFCDTAKEINDKFMKTPEKKEIVDINDYINKVLDENAIRSEKCKESNEKKLSKNKGPIYLDVKAFNKVFDDEASSRIVEYGNSQMSEETNFSTISRKIEETHVAQSSGVSELQKIINKIKMTEKRAFIFDYDGTLVPITKNPSDAEPDEELLTLLKKLSEKSRVIICTGRTKDIVDEWIPPEIEVFFEHSSFRRVNGEWSSLVSSQSYSLESSIAKFFADRTPGAWLEKKEAGFTYHYTECDPEIGARQAYALYSMLIRVNPENVCIGKGIIEYKLSKKDKCLDYIDEEVFMLAGDDKTDEDLFKKGDNITVKVGKGMTIARYCVKDFREFRMLIEAIMRNI